MKDIHFQAQALDARVEAARKGRTALTSQTRLRLPVSARPDNFRRLVSDLGRGARSRAIATRKNCFRSNLLVISGIVPRQPRMCSGLTTSRVRVSRRRIVREVRPFAVRYDVIAVYLVRNAQYQFCNCGVLYIMHVEVDLH